MPKITSVAFCLFLAILSPLSHSDFICQKGPCDIQITYENGGELTASQAIITFGDGASIQLGESGSYDLGLSGYIYDSGITDLDAQTDIPAGTKVYLGAEAKLVFSNEGYLHLGSGGNIENLGQSETHFNGVSNIENLTDSTLLFAPTSNEQADYTFIASNSIMLDSTLSSHFKVQSDEVTIQSYDLNIAIPDILEAKTLNFLVYNGEIQLETQIPFNEDASSMSLTDLTLTSGPTISISDEICTIGEAPCSVHISGNDTATISTSISNSDGGVILDDISHLINAAEDLMSSSSLTVLSEQNCVSSDTLTDYTNATDAYVQLLVELNDIAAEISSTDNPTQAQLDELSNATSALDNFSYSYGPNEDGEYTYIFKDGEWVNFCNNVEIDLNTVETKDEGSGTLFTWFLLGLFLVAKRPK